MATNHDETLQERYARELAAMEPKTPMVKVMASNWQEDGLAPTWQQLLKAQIEYDELRARVVALEVENVELKAKLTEKAYLLRGCYAADHKQKQRIEELAAERDALKADYERACKLVADMHMAAMGGVVGPVLGVVEDVAALKAENERLLAANRDCIAHYEDARAELERIKSLEPVAWLSTDCIGERHLSFGRPHDIDPTPLYALGSTT